MSSLLSKLKTLISANLRGAEHREEPSAEGAQESTGMPEVTEAPAGRQKLPEVAEATQSHHEPARPAANATEAASRVAESQKPEEKAETLEEERIVDLLKGEQS
jgi:spore germination cell wall hydrolase CwlJ-like protein